MRFADTDGSIIDVYQAITHNTDESNMAQPSSINFLLDRALGSEGYYGLFTVLIHTDIAPSAESDAVIAAAQSRGVPVISSKQAFTWWDGRDKSSFRDFSWNGSTVSFRVIAGPGTNGLRAMLPLHSGSKQLTSITRAGTSVPFTINTIKGIDYAFFGATAATYSATYS